MLHDAQRLANVAAVLSRRMRRLVDAGHRREHEPGTFVAHAPYDLRGHLTVDLQPTLDVAAKVRARGAKRRTRGERGELPSPRESACDHAQRGDAVGHELEDRRRMRIQV